MSHGGKGRGRRVYFNGVERGEAHAKVDAGQVEERGKRIVLVSREFIGHGL